MSSNKYRILIIEDELNIRSFVKTILETNGYQVLTSGTAKQGEWMVTSHCPDLIILDLGLPDMDGVELIKKFVNFQEYQLLFCLQEQMKMIKLFLRLLYQKK